MPPPQPSPHLSSNADVCVFVTGTSFARRTYRQKLSEYLGNAGGRPFWGVASRFTVQFRGLRTNFAASSAVLEGQLYSCDCHYQRVFLFFTSFSVCLSASAWCRCTSILHR